MSDVGESSEGTRIGRSWVMKAFKRGTKRATESGSFSQRIDGLMGEMAKVQKFISDFGDSHDG